MSTIICNCGFRINLFVSAYTYWAILDQILTSCLYIFQWDTTAFLFATSSKLPLLMSSGMSELLLLINFTLCKNYVRSQVILFSCLLSINSSLRSFPAPGIACQGKFRALRLEALAYEDEKKIFFCWKFLFDLCHSGFCRFDPQTGLLTGTKDGTLVNLFLRLFGRCTEKSLCIRLLVFQVICHHL